MVRHSGSALDDGRVQAQALIASFKSQLPARVLGELFDIPASTWYERQQSARKPDVKRLTERARVRELFYASEDSAGARTLAFQLATLGMTIGRHKVARLMKEAELTSNDTNKREMNMIWFRTN